MKAMILAAGRGARMRHLTQAIPKPLLKVREKPLIVHHLEALSRIGIQEVIINVSYLGHKIEAFLKNGSDYNLHIHYSYEDPILGTGGGIAKALPWLGADPFIVISSDIFTDYDFKKLPMRLENLAHLVLVDNPSHHPRGDFGIREGRVVEQGVSLLNFAGIGVYRPELFIGCPTGEFSISPVFKRAMQDNQITGEYYQGLWHNVGTPEQISDLNQCL